MWKMVSIFLFLYNQILFAEHPDLESKKIELFRQTVLHPKTFDHFLRQVVEMESDAANQEVNVEEVVSQVKKTVSSDEFIRKFISSYDAFSEEEIEWLLDVHTSKVTAEHQNIWLQQLNSAFQGFKDVTQGILHSFPKIEKSALEASASDFVVPITEGLFLKEVLQSETPVVMDCYAQWCFPCKKMAPILSELSREWSDRIKFVSFDVESDARLAKELKIRGMPTFLFFKGGKVVGRHTGALTKDDLIKKMNQFIF